MADTFSNDLRLRLQESGSNAGTWGDLLNGTITNIASGFGQGSEAIPNASTHTITLADGTADEARSLYLKCTGGGQACTVTLGPNTISKVWIIDNATSYTLTFSQGSGANVSIAAGAVKVIATDGAGSGAAVVDTLDGLEGALSTLAVTGTATFTVGTNAKGTFSDSIGEVGAGNFALQVTNSAGSALKPLGFRAEDIRFATGSSERLRIDSSGRVGIGASTPTQELEIKAASVPTLKLNQAGTYGAEITLRGNDLDIKGSANAVVFYTGGNNDVSSTERLRLDSAGLLLHGTSAQLGNGWLNSKFNGTVYNGLVLQTTRSAINSTFVGFLNSSGATAGVILHNGSTTVSYGTSSDQRMKQNILDSDDSGTTIDSIKIRKFDWIAGGAHEKYGFIAQELKTVVPNAICPMGMPDDEDPMLGVDPSKLMALAIKEIQSLRARVAELENN